MVQGKSKGSAYEREQAKNFSQWWCDKEKEIWRSDLVMGGVPEYPADLSPNGYEAKDFPFAVECKNSSQWSFKSLIEDDNICYIHKWWTKLVRKVGEYEEKKLLPLLVFTQNYHDDYLATSQSVYNILSNHYCFNPIIQVSRSDWDCDLIISKLSCMLGSDFDEEDKRLLLGEIGHEKGRSVSED